MGRKIKNEEHMDALIEIIVHAMNTVNGVKNSANIFPFCPGRAVIKKTLCPLDRK